MNNYIIIGSVSLITLSIAYLMIRLRKPMSFNKFKKEHQKITRLIGLIDTNDKHNYVLKQLYIQYLDHYHSFTQNKYSLVQNLIKMTKIDQQDWNANTFNFNTRLDDNIFIDSLEPIKNEKLKLRFNIDPIFALGLAFDKEEKALHIILICMTMTFYKSTTLIENTL